jgi:hypothetical protein
MMVINELGENRHWFSDFPPGDDVKKTILTMARSQVPGPQLQADLFIPW